MALAPWQQSDAGMDPETRRRLIAQLIAEQTFGAAQGDTTAGGSASTGYQYPIEGSDPDSTAATDVAAANVVDSTANAAAINAAQNAAAGRDTSSGFNAGRGTTEATSGNLAAQTGMMNPGYNAEAQAAPADVAQTGYFGGNHPGYSPSSFTAAPLGDFTSVNTTVDAVPGAPVDMASVAQNQSAFNANPAAFTAVDMDSVAANQAAFDAMAANQPDNTPSALTGLPNAMDISQGWSPGNPEGAPTGYTGSPTGNVATDVGVGIGLGISGGFGGATGDGTSGGFGGDAGGPGVGGASTGISGGPGGTGEGGANTGEGGTDAGNSGAGGGDGGAGK